MKKHLTIIGGGFSSWISASVFADSGYYVDIFVGKNQNFGSQQISPNGWMALSNLIGLKDIQKYLWSNHYQQKYLRLSKKKTLHLL